MEKAPQGPARRGLKHWLVRTPTLKCDPLIQTPTDESGWAWFIPLHTGVTSVGVVVNKEVYTRRARSQSGGPAERSSPGNGTSTGTASTRRSLLQILGGYLGFSKQTPHSAPPSTSPSTQQYLETVELAPGLKKLLGDGKLVNRPGVDGNDSSLVHTASDYSYSADKYAGHGWRVIGDAGGKQPRDIMPFLY